MKDGHEEAGFSSTEAGLIAAPLAVGEIVEQIPEGRVVTLPSPREQLADRFGAEYTCPLATGILLRIAAEAVQAQRLLAEGVGCRSVSPTSWRVRLAESVRVE